MTKTNKILIAVIAGLVLLCGGMYLYSSNLSRSNKNWKHNYEVLQDSVEVIKTKNGELLFENGSLIISKNELERALDISKKEVKEYEKKLGSKLAYISKLESQLNVKDTIVVEKEKIIHDTLTNSYSMSYNDSWLKFDETFSLLNPFSPKLSVYNIGMNVPLKVGLTDDYTIFVTSPNPYFNITSIDGAVIDKGKFAPKPKRWGFGLYAGWGIQYGIINKQIDTGPQVGGGVEFRF